MRPSPQNQQYKVPIIEGGSGWEEDLFGSGPKNTACTEEPENPGC